MTKYKKDAPSIDFGQKPETIEEYLGAALDTLYLISARFSIQERENHGEELGEIITFIRKAWDLVPQYNRKHPDFCGHTLATKCIDCGTLIMHESSFAPMELPEDLSKLEKDN